MKITDYPIGEIPFETMEKAIKYKRFIRGEYIVALRHDFVPTTKEQDLKTGGISELIYWYPDYIDDLYAAVIVGKDWVDVIGERNEMNFLYFFPSIVKKLDKILTHTRKLNHLEETKIINGRVMI